MESIASLVNETISNIVLSFAKSISEKYDLSQEDIISLWNSASDLEVIVKKKKEVNGTQCAFIKVKGKDKGSQCSKKASDGSEFCYVHNKDKADPKSKKTTVTCNHVFKKGMKKGKKCPSAASNENEYCNTHSKLYVKAEDDEEEKKEE
jgi:hypothetical protein